jgi:polar amino acid transport system permease protein
VIQNFLSIFANWETIAWGLLTTLWICALSAVISFFIALVAVIVIKGGNRYTNTVLKLIVDTLRSIPFLLLLFLIYYCLPHLGLRMSAWTCGLIAMTAYNAAYFIEIMRGAWAHFGHEQEETGYAFGFYGLRLYKHIVFPQILITSAPMLGNQLITLVKNSAFLMVITIPELTFVSNQLQAMYFFPLEMMFIAILLYWSICLAIEALVRKAGRIAFVRGSQ